MDGLHINIKISPEWMWIILGIWVLLLVVPFAIGFITNYLNKKNEEKKKKLVDEGLKKIREKEKNS